jgi:hypothetical protein
MICLIGLKKIIFVCSLLNPSLLAVLLRLPHQFITELFGYIFTQITERLNTKLPLIQQAIPLYPTKAVFFTDLESRTMCFPALSSFSSLDESIEVTTAQIASNPIGSFSPSFAPYVCSARTRNCKYSHAMFIKDRFELNHGYYRGWSFEQDRPGMCLSVPPSVNMSVCHSIHQST